MNPYRSALSSRLSAAARLGAVAGLLCTIWGAASAQTAGDGVKAFIEQQMPTGKGRVEIAVGSLDPRLQLAPCGRIEPYLLPGTRLWGRTSIGVRCLSGANWAVSLPITVSVFGPAVVATEPMAAGANPSQSSLQVIEAELTREHGTPVTDPAQLVGRTLTRPVAAGQVIRVEQLRMAQTVASGDPLKIEMIGRGFVIQGEGQALGAGSEGQPIRVRTDNGRIVGGTLRGRTVEIRI